MSAGSMRSDRVTLSKSQNHCFEQYAAYCVQLVGRFEQASLNHTTAASPLYSDAFGCVGIC